MTTCGKARCNTSAISTKTFYDLQATNKTFYDRFAGTGSAREALDDLPVKVKEI